MPRCFILPKNSDNSSLANALLVTYNDSESLLKAKEVMSYLNCSDADFDKYLQTFNDNARTLGVNGSELNRILDGDYSSLKGKKFNLLDLSNLINSPIRAQLKLNSTFKELKSNYNFSDSECLFYLTELINEKRGDNDFMSDLFLRRLKSIGEYTPSELTPMPVKPAEYVKESLSDALVLLDLPVPNFKSYDFATRYVLANMPAEGCSPESKSELFNEGVNDYRSLILSSLKEDFNNLKRKRVIGELNAYFKGLN